VTRVGGEWLTRPGTRAVFGCLIDAGQQAFAVGGCVRNDLLGMPVSDVDFATDARPERVMELAGRAGLKAVPTGIAHGTVTLVAGDVGHEVTTFRRDLATDGRRAVVAFADSPEEDARRRDFTINALYADARGRISDPLGGLADIAARRVRFIDDADARIREDYLRILRFFRFHAWFADPAGGLDPEALDACARRAEGLERLSRERVGTEMRKLLAAPDPAPALAAMAAAGVLARVLPGADAGTLAVLVHLEAETGQAPSWLRRLACLGGDDPAPRLRLTRRETARLRLYRAETGSATTLDAIAYRHGAGAAIDLALLRAALTGTPLPEGLAARADFAAGQRFPLRGHDITTGETGPALGRKLKRLEEAWIASGFRLNREDLLG